MPRNRKPYFEIRLEFDTEEERNKYQEEFEAALKEKGYVTRREWLRDMIRILKGR